MAQAPNRTKVGTLTCDISGGIGLIITSHKDVACMFTPSQPGPREVYTGSINKFGLDLGATAGGEMIWAVYAPSTRKFGALAGHYGGASGEATVGAGVGANVLVGGSNRTVIAAAGIGAGPGRPQSGGWRGRSLICARRGNRFDRMKRHGRPVGRPLRYARVFNQPKVKAS